MGSGFFIYFNKNLQRHPYTLIALELIMHGAMYLNQELNLTILEIPFYKTLDYTLFWRENTWRDYYLYFKVSKELSFHLYRIFF